ncbi:MAG: glycosyltransferase family 4 protein [Alphaproteobacteria bacterium]|nr:glycosyltransferase family 4 protein [Alphaproteobacteria bacterium]
MIVMLTCQYTEILGGAEKQCATLTKALRAQGEEVVVASSRVPGCLTVRAEEGVKRFGTYRSPGLAGRHLPAALLWAAQVFFWIAFNRKKIRVLHCHQLRINAYVAALANALFGIPTVMKPGVGGQANDFAVIGTRKYLLKNRGTSFVARHAKAVVATSSQIAQDALVWGVPEERVHLIPNGVDLERAGPEWPEMRKASFDENIQIAYVGRFTKEKNVIPLIDAVCSLSPARPMTLNLIGDGPLESEVIARVKRASLNKNIRIKSYGRVEDAFGLLKQAHFLALISAHEGLSNALLEAVSVGTVPILSDVSGNRDVVSMTDYPLFVKNADVAEIGRAIQRACSLTSEDWSNLSGYFMSRAKVRYDIKNIAKEYQRLYRHVMAE